MEYYSKQPNGLYCCYSTAINGFYSTNIPESNIEDKISCHDNNIIQFTEILKLLKSYTAKKDIKSVQDKLRNIGYAGWAEFMPDCCQNVAGKNGQPNKKGNPKYTFDYVRNNGLLLYEYIRGSQSYGLALPTSDVDTGAVFCMNSDDLYGINSYKVEDIKDEKGDASWFEIGKYIELLCNANPAALEALFVPERCILYMHPAFKVIYDNRDIFVTKKCFKSFFSYGYTQVKRCRGLNKRITKPVTELLTVLSFCRTPINQGSTQIETFLNARGLKQRYVGLNKISHMELLQGAYYDYGTHLRVEYNADTFKQKYFSKDPDFQAFMKFMCDNNVLTLFDRIKLFFSFHKYDTILKMIQPKGYHGIMRDDGKSNEIRLDSILKNDKPICYLEYNKDGYTLHCNEYRDTQEWIHNRNQQRYLENKEKEFDRKNVEHSYRLTNMGIEIAKTGKVNVDRTDIDREFLLNIRLGNATYDELIAGLDAKMEEFNAAASQSTLPDDIEIGKEEINKMLINIRKQIADKNGID